MTDTRNTLITYDLAVLHAANQIRLGIEQMIERGYSLPFRVWLEDGTQVVISGEPD